ncbi:UDP-N-acetylglucosamine--N-acetylmuramyl-(pentapeptide) pyrophosphoryl-undecaprenol N-acetylglucosamine transferase [Sphingomonas abietis]|uniref:UDP-N-acetylglucosamine--N-acetylmuramyl-(pentapeptide) pyrophosphoryl-undecaprenol N-acetylglucosamine transferase n=2 Tax=Sphingomonas abietis TaxID=3012344 RepID=A0ABY7NVU2_9SPHN|nr:UDP-N-acetylglucosamine--N-acetylmuramyl-(pentapeptide) pyrophosphoryl-undecaprenol N-acetylglucosamine transferase [Sphingomonas abietis]WBO24556.1 UDP-N-acetylglucosamine--N-acetylmuramyl-(pentapeptide) pyrophosphoryl-undecaprenol N-acetylglucosamine transferase [Sphingomonas abietis]
MIPAHALAEELIARGHKVVLVTDDRGARIPGIFKGVDVHVLPAGRLGGGVLGWIGAAKGIWAGRKAAKALIRQYEPAAAIGFGGYPALPTLLAALSEKVPTGLHEQNAVLGRVNRLLARFVKVLATAYHRVDRVPAKIVPVIVGNPVRAEILALRDQPYPPLTEDGIFRLLITGGSQGASVLSTVVPDALGLLPVSLRQRLQVTQQCRPEDIEKVRARYAELDIPADLATYLGDLPERLGWSHLFVGRSGASTIAELTAAGRPAILVPLPTAMDDHQTANAREMAATGGAASIPQSRFTPQQLAKQMQKMALEPGALENAAHRARDAGYPQATQALADLVESLAGPTPAPVGPAPAFKEVIA